MTRTRYGLCYALLGVALALLLLANIAAILNVAGYNIANLRLARTKREGDVITVIEIDAPVDQRTADSLLNVEGVLRVISLPKF